MVDITSKKGIIFTKNVMYKERKQLLKKLNEMILCFLPLKYLAEVSHAHASRQPLSVIQIQNGG